MPPEGMPILPELEGLEVGARFLISLGVLGVGILLRVVAVRLIRGGEDVLTDRRRRWMISARNSINALVVLAVLIVWAPEIQEFAFSIAAVAVALVIATKELILCISGGLWERTARVFSIGDWVEIGGYSGEVIDRTLFVIQLQEIEPREFRYTGRTVSVPNALMLTQPVINHNFRRRFLEHEFTLHAPAEAPVTALRHAIAGALDSEFADFESVARRYAAVIEKRAGLKLPDVAPTVRVGATDLGIPSFRCALFCPRDRAADIEDAAARAMFAALASHGHAGQKVEKA